jgi:hypothetical protein
MTGARSELDQRRRDARVPRSAVFLVSRVIFSQRGLVHAEPASPHERAPTVDDHDMSCRVGVAEQPDHGLGAVLRTG